MPGAVYIPIDQLLRVLAVHEAVLLAQWYGGTRVYLPHPSRLREENPVARAIGREPARRLCTEWPQLDVMVPRLKGELVRARDRAIRANPEGLSVRELARRYQVSERHIYLARLGRGQGQTVPDLDECPERGSADRDQLDLF